MIPFLATVLDLNRLPLFPLGRVLATPGAIALLKETATQPDALLARHVTGDWGELCAEDAQTNRDALVHGGRLMSVYRLDVPADLATGSDEVPDTRLWIITEADRSVTTLLLPEEY